MQHRNQDTLDELKSKLQTPEQAAHLLRKLIINHRRSQYYNEAQKEISVINDTNRALIEAVHVHEGEAWLGKVNLYDDDGKQWRFDYGATVWNCSADYVLPERNQEIEDMVIARDNAPYTGTKDDYERVKAIHEAIEEAGGYLLHWV